MASVPMRRVVFVDYEKCIGCYACVIACKMEHNPLLCAESCGYSLIRIFHVGPKIKDGKVHQYFVPILCLHCDDPPCISKCPVNAISQYVEGAVHVDYEKCIGCKLCSDACPYGAPQFNSNGKMMICDLCLKLVHKGKKTACEAACPAKCIHVCTLDEVGQEVLFKIEKSRKILIEIRNALPK